MKLYDFERVKGEMFLKVIHEDGTVLRELTKTNLVVNTGKSAAAHAIGSLTGAKQVTQFGIGTGTVSPALTDVAPLTSQFKKAIAAVSYPDTASVQFDWTIELSEGNGLTITEYGLFCFDNSLFSRIVSGAIVKTNTIRLVGSWKITF